MARAAEWSQCPEVQRRSLSLPTGRRGLCSAQLAPSSSHGPGVSASLTQGDLTPFCEGEAQPPAFPTCQPARLCPPGPGTLAQVLNPCPIAVDSPSQDLCTPWVLCLSHLCLCCLQSAPSRLRPETPTSLSISPNTPATSVTCEYTGHFFFFLHIWKLVIKASYHEYLSDFKLITRLPCSYKMLMSHLL